MSKKDKAFRKPLKESLDSDDTFCILGFMRDISRDHKEV